MFRAWCQAPLQTSLSYHIRLISQPTPFTYIDSHPITGTIWPKSTATLPWYTAIWSQSTMMTAICTRWLSTTIKTREWTISSLTLASMTRSDGRKGRKSMPLWYRAASHMPCKVTYFLQWRAGIANVRTVYSQLQLIQQESRA